MKKPIDTTIILCTIFISGLWINGKFKDLRKNISNMSVLIMEEVDSQSWHHMAGEDPRTCVIKVFKDDKFLVQVRKHGNATRLCVNKIERIIKKGEPHWKDGITWDELQEIKNKCGFKDQWLCEYFPPESEVVNVANIRHLWVLDEPPYDSLNRMYGIKRLADR